MKCENCDHEHDGSYGSGRFCSKHCRMQYIGRKSYKTKISKGNFQSPFSNPNTLVRKAKGNWKCPFCNMLFRTRREMQTHKKIAHGFIPGVAWNKGLTKDTDERVKKMANTIKTNYDNGIIKPSFKGRHHTIDAKRKMSEIQKENFIKGINRGWLTRKVISFPESFWKRVLDNNAINYQFQLRISHKELGLESRSCYFLDFALPGKVDLEIDGAQHRFRKDYDIKRNKDLEQNGWTVYRIEWNDIVSTNGKLEMKEKIDKFLKWYKNFCEVDSPQHNEKI